jgi:hypothetical protein
VFDLVYRSTRRCSAPKLLRMTRLGSGNLSSRYYMTKDRGDGMPHLFSNVLLIAANKMKWPCQQSRLTMRSQNEQRQSDGCSMLLHH